MITVSLLRSLCALRTIRHILENRLLERTYNFSKGFIFRRAGAQGLGNGRYALASSLITVALLAGCNTAPSQKNSAPPSVQQGITQLNEYKVKIAQKIQAQNAPLLASGSPQSMLRSVVVMAFKVDKQGQLMSWSVYRTNGDAQAEQLALSSLQRAAPLPVPPQSLFGNAGEIEIVEGWLFNNDGKFQIRTLAAPQR